MDIRVQETVDSEIELQNCLKTCSAQSESATETFDGTGSDISFTEIGPESIAYEIERLVDVRKDENGQHLYQARWVAHTWIPEEYLLSFPLLLKQYWDERRQKQNIPKLGEESHSFLVEELKEKEQEKGERSIHEGTGEAPSGLSKIVSQSYLCEKTIENVSCHKCDHEPLLKKCDHEPLLKKSDHASLLKKCDHEFLLKNNYNTHADFQKEKDEQSEIRGPESVGYLSLTESSTCITRKEYSLKNIFINESQQLINYHLKVANNNSQVMENEYHREFLYKQSLSDFSTKQIFSNIIDQKSPMKASIKELIHQNVSKEFIPKVREKVENFEKLFKCCVCCRAFPSREEMKEHEVRHVSTSSRYTCATCGAKFITRIQLKEHYDSNSNECSPRKCEICSKVFIHGNHLKRHMTIHAGLKPFICPICDHEFNQRSDLQRHHKRHILSDGSYVCNKCAKRYESIDKLKNHILIEHKLDETSKSNIFKCDRCDKVFGRKSHYKRHLTIHEGIKPHICQLCFKSFNQKTDLNRHTMTHLRKHMNIFGENSENTCEVCNKTFTTQAKFVEHYLSHQKIMF